MKYQVFMTPEASEDLWDIYRFIWRNDGQHRADRILAGLQETCQSLTNFPGKGHLPPELDRIGVTGFLEVHYKPYRIIYQITGKRVYIHAVLDGRRDMQELLERRMIR